MRGEISIHFLKEGSAVDEFELRSLSSQMAADRGSALFLTPEYFAFQIFSETLDHNGKM